VSVRTCRSPRRAGRAGEGAARHGPPRCTLPDDASPRGGGSRNDCHRLCVPRPLACRETSVRRDRRAAPGSPASPRTLHDPYACAPRPGRRRDSTHSGPTFGLRTTFRRCTPGSADAEEQRRLVDHHRPTGPVDAATPRGAFLVKAGSPSPGTVTEWFPPAAPRPDHGGPCSRLPASNNRS
jgi:hypothetical protein